MTVRAAAGGTPGGVVGTLAWPVTAPFDTERTLRFAASGGIQLAADSTYFVVFDVNGVIPSGTELASTLGAGEDAGAAAGWTVADTHLNRVRSASSWSTTFSQALKIGVNGDANTVPAPAAPSALVSNVYESSTGFPDLFAFDHAQAFSTGSSSAGYSLSSVDVLFAALTDADVCCV